MKVKLKGREMYYNYQVTTLPNFMPYNFNRFYRCIDPILTIEGEYGICEFNLSISEEELRRLQSVEHEGKGYKILEKRYDFSNNQWVLLISKDKYNDEERKKSHEIAEEELKRLNDADEEEEKKTEFVKKKHDIRESEPVKKKWFEFW